MNLGKRRTIAFAAISAVAAAGLAAMAAPAQAAVSCSVAYSPNYWGGGFTIGLKVTNSGDALSSWTLVFNWGGDQKITNGWNGTWTQSGSQVTVKNVSYNGSVSTGGTIDIGGQGTWGSSSAAPSSYSVNGTTCGGGSGGGGGGSTTTTTRPTTTTTTRGGVTTTTTRPTTTTTTRGGVTTTTTRGGVTTTTTRGGVTTTTTTRTSGGGGGGGTHVDNPFVGAKQYVNPDWSAKAAAEPGGSRIANQPTGVWLDSIAAVTAPAGSGYTTSLAGHLDNALSQGANLATFVIYDLPGRDCAALASNGELGPTELGRYESEYIDPIAAIEANPKYAGIRIVNIIEIDSLPNLVTNAGSAAGATAACATMQQNGNYVNGIAYALGKLHAVGTNTYNYIDAAHHAWLGWDTNFAPAATLFATTAQKATGGFATVDGFISNTANYSATKEPYFTINTTVGGTSVRQSKWVDWNFYVDELTFDQAFRTQLISDGFASNIGMLIDTSRNGWGGPNRPTGPSTSTVVDTFVNASRIDRRIHAGNWCNQSGAGLGARPTVAPESGIDAYVWIKPPGESDGSSTLIPTGPNNPGGKGLDGMCDPSYTGNGRNGNSMSGALPNSPVSGAWFSAQFQQLMTNAFPAL